MFTLSGQDTFDSNDVENRIDELQDDFDSWKDENPESDDEEFEDYDELTTLNEFKDEHDSRVWRSGIFFINESYFEDYAEQYAYDVGDIREDSPMVNHIDWESYADDLKSDYTSIDFDGETYYYLG